MRLFHNSDHISSEIERIVDSHFLRIFFHISFYNEPLAKEQIQHYYDNVTNDSRNEVHRSSFLGRAYEKLELNFVMFQMN